MKVFHKKRAVEIPVRCLGFFGRISGLMFRGRETENLLFDFYGKTDRSFHSFFCFFPFLILWLDENNKVVGLKIVEPFIMRISSPKPYWKAVELSLNKKNKKIIEFFVGKERAKKFF